MLLLSNTVSSPPNARELLDLALLERLHPTPILSCSRVHRPRHALPNASRRRRIRTRPPSPAHETERPLPREPGDRRPARRRVARARPRAARPGRGCHRTGPPARAERPRVLRVLARRRRARGPCAVGECPHRARREPRTRAARSVGSTEFRRVFAFPLERRVLRALRRVVVLRTIRRGIFLLPGLDANVILRLVRCQPGHEPRARETPPSAAIEHASARARTRGGGTRHPYSGRRGSADEDDSPRLRAEAHGWGRGAHGWATGQVFCFHVCAAYDRADDAVRAPLEPRARFDLSAIGGCFLRRASRSSAGPAVDSSTCPPFCVAYGHGGAHVSHLGVVRNDRTV
jgi:hypothetical protein